MRRGTRAGEESSTSSMDSKMMDASHPERKQGVMATNNKRVCGAIKQLVAEVLELFPETKDAVEYSNYDGRNTALDVSFDLTALDDTTDQRLLAESLTLVVNDVRVHEVIREKEQVLVSMRSSLRTQDLRVTFNLGQVYEVLIEDLEGSW